MKSPTFINTIEPLAVIKQLAIDKPAQAIKPLAVIK